MRPWTERVYGVPPQQVVGSSIKTKFEIRDGRPELLRLPEINFIDDKAGKPIGIKRAGENWHSDMCYTARPPRGTMLHALEVPELHGLTLGDTEFASAAAAYHAEKVLTESKAE